MRKNRILGFLFIFIGLLLFLGNGINRKLQLKEEIKVHNSEFEDFDFIGLSGRKNRLKNNVSKSRVIIFFNSECDHCQKEAMLIKENIDLFLDAEICFLSIEPLKLILGFAQKFDLQNLENVVFGQVEADEVAKKFGISGFPSVFIYSKEGKLLEEFKGMVKVSALTKYL